MTESWEDWQASLVRARNRGAQTCDQAADLVAAVFRDDDTAAVIVIDGVSDDDAGDLVHGCLRLCYALAQRNRTPQGLLELQGAWLDVQDEEWAPDRRNAAVLTNAFMRATDALQWDAFDMVGLDPAVHHNIAAEDFNKVVADAGERFYEVLLAAVKIWHSLLPEVSPASIENVAAAMRTQA